MSGCLGQLEDNTKGLNQGNYSSQTGCISQYERGKEAFKLISICVWLSPIERNWLISSNWTYWTWKLLMISGCNHWSVYFDSGRCHCRNSLSWQRKRGRLIPLSTLFVWILAEWKLKTHHTWQALDRVCTGKWCLQNCQQKCNKPPIKCTAIYAWTLKLKLPCVSFSSNSNVFSRSSAWQMQADVIIVYNKVDSVTSSSLWS